MQMICLTQGTNRIPESDMLSHYPGTWAAKNLPQPRSIYTFSLPEQLKKLPVELYLMIFYLFSSHLHFSLRQKNPRK